jgi:hypothetical protein
MLFALLTVAAFSHGSSIPMKASCFLCFTPYSTLLHVSSIERHIVSPSLMRKVVHSSTADRTNTRGGDRNYQTIRFGYQESGSDQEVKESIHLPVPGLNTSGDFWNSNTPEINDSPLRGSRRGIVSANTLAQAG